MVSQVAKVKKVPKGVQISSANQRGPALAARNSENRVAGQRQP